MSGLTTHQTSRTHCNISVVCGKRRLLGDESWLIARSCRSAQGTVECMFCHNSYPERITGAEDAAFTGKMPEGIDCQRCHGPGQAHLRRCKMPASLRRKRRSIVNPARSASNAGWYACSAIWNRQRSVTVCITALRQDPFRTSQEKRFRHMHYRPALRPRAAR